MGILAYITDANIKAFNNMLRHVEQPGQEIAPNLRAARHTPVVQAIKTGAFWTFISCDIFNGVVYHNESGTMKAVAARTNIISRKATNQRKKKP